MASLIEELISVLEETTGCYESLRIVANNKKEVIIKGDVPSLQTLTDEEQGVAGRLLRLEKKRQELIEDVCLVTNKDPKTMTVSSLIDLLQGQKDEQTRLKKVSQHMIEVVDEVKKINDINKTLIKESLDYVSFTMNALQSASSMPQGNAYQKKGGLYDQQNGRNFFDAKQ